MVCLAAPAFAGVTRYEQTDPSVAYTGTWTNSSLPGHSGGSVLYSSQVNATATFSFTGTGVVWIAAKWYNRGIAAVSLDGGPEQMVDLYAPGVSGDTSTVSFQQAVYSASGLSNGPHTLRIRVTGNHNAAATTPYLITVDAFDVTTPDPPPPVVSTSASSPWSIAVLAVLGLAGAGAVYAVRRRGHV
jgi:hypothetical protein